MQIPRKERKYNYSLLSSIIILSAEPRRPEEPLNGAPHSYGKEKETHELIFSWLSWLAVLLVGTFARRISKNGRFSIFYAYLISSL